MAILLNLYKNVTFYYEEQHNIICKPMGKVKKRGEEIGAEAGILVCHEHRVRQIYFILSDLCQRPSHVHAGSLGSACTMQNTQSEEMTDRYQNTFETKQSEYKAKMVIRISRSCLTCSRLSLPTSTRER